MASGCRSGLFRGSGILDRELEWRFRASGSNDSDQIISDLGERNEIRDGAQWKLTVGKEVALPLRLKSLLLRLRLMSLKVLFARRAC